jgi:hypothetical protein
VVCCTMHVSENAIHERRELSWVRGRIPEVQPVAQRLASAARGDGNSVMLRARKAICLESEKERFHEGENYCVWKV